MLLERQSAVERTANAAFCDEHVKIEQVDRDGGRVMCAQIVPIARAPAVLGGEVSNGQQ